MMARHFRDLLLIRWWIVSLSMLFVGLGAVGVTLFTPPLYEAATLVRIDLPSTDTAIVAGFSRLTYTQSQLAMSSPVLTNVASHYPGMTLEKLRSQLTVVQVPNTFLIQIVVRDSSPSFAATLADDVARTLISQQSDASDRANRLARQPVLDAISTTNSQIVDALVEQAHLKAIRADPTALADVQTKLDALTAQLTQQETTLGAIESDQTKNGFYLSLAQPAQVSAKPGRSSYLVIAAGLVLGLLAGLVIVVGFDLFDQRLKSLEELADALLCPVLAELALPEKQNDGQDAGKWYAEAAMPQLLQALTFLHVQRQFRSVAVTSLRAEEKKDVLAASLAVASSSQGNAALLVDCDLGRPSQHAYFGVRNAQGVGGAILALQSSGTAEGIDQYFERPLAPTLGALRVLPAGPRPPNAAKVVGSAALKEVFAALTRSRADAIIVDTPPIGARDRGQDVCALADGALVVVDLATTRRYEAFAARHALDSAGVTLLGCVVVTHAHSGPQRRSAAPQTADAKAEHASASADANTTTAR